MSDHTYFMSCLNQNIGYNQPTNLGYFLGAGMDMDQVPLQELTPDGIQVINEAKSNNVITNEKIYDLSGRVADTIVGGLYIINGRKVMK